MHQSIPAVPIFPGNRGAFAHVVSPGDGAFASLSQPGSAAFAILSQPQGSGISIPRGDRWTFYMPVFERLMSLL